jgi:hypothetical protein
MQSPSPSPRSRALSRTVLLLPFRLAGRRAHLSAAHSVASRRAPTNSRASAAASALGLFGRERDQFDECDESGDPFAGPDFLLFSPGGAARCARAAASCSVPPPQPLLVVALLLHVLLLLGGHPLRSPPRAAVAVAGITTRH